MKAIFISVRTESTRLPKKALLQICGKPTISYLIEALKKSQHADDIILCTSTMEADDELCEIATHLGIKYYRGSLEDKLQRWLGACKEYEVDFFVNVDGDDIFFDPGLADLCFQQEMSSAQILDFIDGRGLYNDVYGISYEALKVVCSNKPDNDTEFIRPHFVSPSYNFTVETVQGIPEKYLKKDIRMTLDYEEDFFFFSKIIGHFVENSLQLDFESVLEYLANNPEVVEINWNREQNWKDNQKKMIERVNVQ